MGEIKNERYELIDALRAITIISMMLYHFMYDIQIINFGNYNWLDMLAVNYWQKSILISFVFISGISWNLSRHRLKNGIMLSLLGLLITIITMKFIPEEQIIWGVLSFFGAAYILMIPLDKILKKVSPIIIFIIAMILFFLFDPIDLKFGPLDISFLRNYRFGFIFGATTSEFYSADYVPILPWIFVFILGYAFWNIFKTNQKFLEIAKMKIKYLSQIGKKSLSIYLLHQPILYLLAKIVVKLNI